MFKFVCNFLKIFFKFGGIGVFFFMLKFNFIVIGNF